jgi:hypothetical protein
VCGGGGGRKPCRKEGRNLVRRKKEGRWKEGKKEGRKEGRKEALSEGRKKEGGGGGGGGGVEKGQLFSIPADLGISTSICLYIDISIYLYRYTHVGI